MLTSLQKKKNETKKHFENPPLSRPVLFIFYQVGSVNTHNAAEGDTRTARERQKSQKKRTSESEQNAPRTPSFPSFFFSSKSSFTPYPALPRVHSVVHRFRHASFQAGTW